MKSICSKFLSFTLPLWVLLCCHFNSIAVIAPGHNKEKMIAELGEPTAEIKRGDRTVYSYPQGTISLKNGIVVAVSEGFYRDLNEFTKTTSSGEAIALKTEDQNLPLVDAAWFENYEAAKALSASAERPLLMLFTGSDWCVWCQRLEQEILSQPEFTAYAAENLVLLKIDFPRNSQQTIELKAQNEQLQMDWDVEGYPTLIISDAQGQFYGMTGYLAISPSDYVDHVREMISYGPREIPTDEGIFRDILGDDLADALDQIEFINNFSGSGLSLSIQILIGCILMFWLIRRFMRR